MSSKAQRPLHPAGVNPPVDSRSARESLHSGSATRGRHRFSETEIEQFLRLEQSGIAVSALCARYGFTLAEFFRWKARFTTETPAVLADELAALRTENQLLRDLVASLLANASRARPHASSSIGRQGNLHGMRGTAAGSLQQPLQTRPDSDD